MGVVLFHADRQKDRRTGRKKLIVTFLNYTKAAKKEKLTTHEKKIPQL